MTEHKPTRKIDTNSSDVEPNYTPQGGGQLYNPQGYGQGYGQGGSHTGSRKTERIRVETPSLAWMVIAEGIHAGHIFRLHPDSTLIGRDPACDIVLDDTSASRQHVKIRAREGDEKEKVYVLHDLASENGTLVNGEEVVQHELEDGDRVQIGRTKLVFKEIKT